MVGGGSEAGVGVVAVVVVVVAAIEFCL